MLRALAGSLIGANLLFYAWTQGWLGTLAPAPPGLRGREPERLEQQVRPETVQVLRPRDVSAALARQAAAATSGSDPQRDPAAAPPRSP